MAKEDVQMVGVKVMLEDGSEIEPSCWAVAFLARGENGKLWPQFSWSRRPHSAEEVIVLGFAIETLLGEYSDANEGIMHLL